MSEILSHLWLTQTVDSCSVLEAAQTLLGSTGEERAMLEAGLPDRMKELPGEVVQFRGR